MSFQEFLDNIDAGNSQFERDRDGDIVYSVPLLCDSDSAHACYLSNAQAIAGRLDAIDSVNVIRVGDNVYITPFQDSGEPTLAALELMKIEEQLSDYPILDEWRYYALRDEYVDENWEKFADQARKLIGEDNMKSIENAVDYYIDARHILLAKDDAAIEKLARALAETEWEK